MTVLQYQCTMSLDGFIAGVGGDMSWLTPFFGPDPAVDEVMRDTGALLVGRRTFGGDDPLVGNAGEAEPYGGGWSGQQVVLTHRPPAADVPGVSFAGDLQSAVAAAVAAAGDKTVGVLGAQVAAQCLAAGILDEILVFVAPVLLGDGVRLFEHDGGTNIALELVERGRTAAVPHLRYRVLR
ncbi:dihydrofolate reductase family protein [Nocardia stercoris]|uniref:Dihydrofolate reductase n=1 Tax=Nocardia stercoris TaxID=2483361 RepID=A0A3M2LF83_9NOCA|nr:dihydrofolate reductase family protein [Nocardia stercoris]RMI35480.1 dihydrofolate reductase [Nocardia stercoris]